jgi:hypothetical protein
MRPQSHLKATLKPGEGFLAWFGLIGRINVNRPVNVDIQHGIHHPAAPEDLVMKPNP